MKIRFQFAFALFHPNIRIFSRVTVIVEVEKEKEVWFEKVVMLLVENKCSLFSLQHLLFSSLYNIRSCNFYL